MSMNKILLFTVIASFSVCDVCQSDLIGEKTSTASRMFKKMKLDQAPNCDYVKNDFHKLQGHWNFVLRTVNARNTPKIRCGHMTVNETSDLGFKSTLTYIMNDKEVVQIPITGNYINETVVQIQQLKTLVTGNPEWKYAPIIEMGLCDNDSILFTEPIHYWGGGMVFTRNNSDSDVSLHLRFRSFDADRAREFNQHVGSDCTISKWRVRNAGILLN